MLIYQGVKHVFCINNRGFPMKYQFFSTNNILYGINSHKGRTIGTLTGGTFVIENLDKLQVVNNIFSIEHGSNEHWLRKKRT
jgi:hypothetical protein